MKRYSLSDYILSIEPNDSTLKNMFGTLSVGGEGSQTDSLTLSLANSQWSTTGYATGGWTHNKNLDRHGTATLSLNQMSEQVQKLIKLVNIFYGGDYDGFTLTLTDREQNKIATCIDSYIEGIPDQAFGNSAANQSWVFNCGQITFE